MAAIPREVRERLVNANEAGRTGTYEQPAKLFAVGEASISRWLRKGVGGVVDAAKGRRLKTTHPLGVAARASCGG